MAVVLVTGGTGVLGRQVVPRLVAAGHLVRTASRQPPSETISGADWVRLDLADGTGLDAALRGVDVVVHAASSPRADTQRIDVDGTARLCEASARVGVRHLVYVSIVGADRVPAAYYRAKADAEDKVVAGRTPWSILRATQFHDLIDAMIFANLDRLPCLFVPKGLRFQPIDAGEVADRLVELVAGPPRGRVPDVGGPEVFELQDMAVPWTEARGRDRRVLPIPVFGARAAAVREGALTCPARRVGRITWDAWLARRYPVNA